jgi:hypothetical protein
MFRKEFLQLLLNISCRIFEEGLINPGLQQSVEG